MHHFHQDLVLTNRMQRTTCADDICPHQGSALREGEELQKENLSVHTMSENLTVLIYATV